MSRFTIWQCVHFIYVISDKEASIGIHSFDFVFCAKVCCYLGLPEPLQQVQAGRGEGLLPVHEHGARLPWLTSQTGKQKREREREREITVSLCCGRLWIVFTVSDNEISDVCVRIDLQHNTFHYYIFSILQDEFNRLIAAGAQRYFWTGTRLMGQTVYISLICIFLVES